MKYTNGSVFFNSNTSCNVNILILMASNVVLDDIQNFQLQFEILSNSKINTRGVLFIFQDKCGRVK